MRLDAGMAVGGSSRAEFESILTFDQGILIVTNRYHLRGCCVPILKSLPICMASLQPHTRQGIRVRDCQGGLPFCPGAVTLARRTTGLGTPVWRLMENLRPEKDILSSLLLFEGGFEGRGGGSKMGSSACYNS